MYIDDARMLSNGYYSTTRYYIVNVTFEDKDSTNSENTSSGETSTQADESTTDTTSSQSYSYRVSKPYTVTPVYFSLKKKGSTEIADVLKSGETILDEWLGESSNAGQLYNADISQGSAVTNGSLIKSPEIGNLKIELDKNEGSTNNVKINDNGSITLPSNFDDAEYIKVNIYVLVSGQDRSLNKETDSNYYYFLGSLKLGKEPSKSSTNTSN